MQYGPKSLLSEPQTYAQPQYQPPPATPEYYTPLFESHNDTEDHETSQNASRALYRFHRSPETQVLPPQHQALPCAELTDLSFPSDQASTPQQQQHHLQEDEFEAVEERLRACKIRLNWLVSLASPHKQRSARLLTEMIEKDIEWLAGGFQVEETPDNSIVTGLLARPPLTISPSDRDTAPPITLRAGVLQQPEVTRGTAGPAHVNFAPISGVTSDLHKGRKKNRRQR